MVRYEILILAVPEITANEATSLESHIEGLIKKASGALLSFERWGKYHLAYPVWSNDYGVYYLIRFEVDKAQSDALVKELDTLFKVKYTQLAMRHMISRLDSSRSLAYFKPESLEEAPSQDVDTFLRENKMKGILNNAGSFESRQAESAELETNNE